MNNGAPSEASPTRGNGGRSRLRVNLSVDEVDALGVGSTWWRRFACWLQTRHAATVHVPWLESDVCRSCGRVEQATPPPEER